MDEQKIIKRTTLTDGITILTTDEHSDELMPGLHATLRTFVLGQEGISPEVPVATYVRQEGALIGHAMVVEQIVRRIAEQRARDEDAVHEALIAGAL